MAVKRIGNININYTVPEAQTQIYNALGRDAGQDAYVQGEANPNFFQKRWNSIKNFGQSTLGALYESGGDLLSPFRSRITGEEYYSHQAQKQNDKTNQLMADNQTRMNDIVKGYGYNSLDDYYNALDDAEVNDKAKYNELLNTVQADLKNQSNANMEAMRQNQADYKDYVQNNFASKNLQQDRGKYLGAGINTFSTAADLTGLSATPLANSIQGGIEGIADELEQNGFENFDLGRAGQNAAIGATTGAVTGALNKGISNKLINPQTGNFKMLNGLASKGNLGKIGATIATGAGRGAISGAVGGATGAGMSALFNGRDVIGSALEGAKQGAVSGATTGGIMAGANMAISKTPGLGKFYNDLSTAKQKWDQSGTGSNWRERFNNRLTNTFNSGESGIGNWLNRQSSSRILNSVGNIGDTIRDYTDQGMGPRKAEARAYEDLIKEYYDDERGGIEGAIADAEAGADPREDFSSFAKARRLVENGNFGVSYDDAFNDLKSIYGDDFNPDIYLNKDGSYKYKNGEPYVWTVYKNKLAMNMANKMDAMDAGTYAPEAETPTTAKGWLKRAGERIVEDANNRGVGLGIKDVSQDMPDDVRNLKINNWDDNNVGQDGQIDARVLKLSQLERPYTSEEIDYLQAHPEDVLKTNSKFLVRELLNTGDANYDSYRKAVIDSDLVRQGRATDTSEYIGSNGQKALKIEMPILDDASGKESSALVKQVVKDLAEEGRLLNVGDIPELAGVSRNSSKKVGGNAGWNDSQLRQRNEVIADIEEVGDYLHNVRYEAPKAGSKDGLAGVIKGDVEIDINGEKIYPEVVYRLYDNGDLVLHDVTKINRLPSDYSSDRNLGRQVRLSEVAEQPSDSIIISQNRNNVNAWDRVAQQAGYKNYDDVIEAYMQANPNTPLNPKGAAGQILTWLDENPNTPTTAKGWAKRAGQRIIEDANERGVGLGIKNVAQETPETEVYRKLTIKQETPETEVDEISPKTSKESRLRYAQGMELLRQYGAVDTPTANSMNAPEVFQEIADMGFTKPGDVEKIANEVTGSHGAVSKLTKNVVKNAAPVDTFTGANGEPIEDFVDNSIELNSLYNTPQGNAIKRTVQASLRSLPSRAEGSISYTDTAEDTFKLVQNLEKKAAELEGRGGTRYSRPSTENVAQAQVLKDVADLYKERIYDGADVKSALTPEVIADLKQKAPNNKAWSKTVDDFVAKAKTPQDLRSFQKPFVRASRFIDNQYAKAAIVGSRTAQSAADLVNIIPATTKAGIIKQAVNVAWNSNPAHRARANLYGKLADRAASNAPTNVDNTAVAPEVIDTNYNPATQIYNAIGRTEGAINAKNAQSANYLADAVKEAEVVPNTGSLEALINPTTTNAQTSVYNSVYGTPTATTAASQQMPTTGYFQPTGDYWTDLIASAMSSAIDDNNVDAFASLYGMYQDAISNLQKQNSTSSETKLTATQQRANAAMNSLERLSGMTPDLGYNLSNIPLVGNIATFGGNDYESEAKSLAQQIGYMVSGSNIKDNEAEAIGKAYVPQPWDSEQTRQSKLRRAYEIISQYQNGYAS